MLTSAYLCEDRHSPSTRRSEFMSNAERITVLLPSEEAVLLTEHCWKNGYKKSTLIARLIREYLCTLPQEEQLPLPLGQRGNNANMQITGRLK